jgi:hypothetical protein
LDSQLFLFNALVLPCISSKSLKFRTELFSIPTAPTKTTQLQPFTGAFNNTLFTNSELLFLDDLSHPVKTQPYQTAAPPASTISRIVP